jgi:hypothetical protein
VEGYLLASDAARNAALHGWGVAAGLEVSAVAGAAGVTVAQGVALDVDGHVVVLGEGGVAIVDPLVGPTGVQNIPTVQVTATGVVLDTTGLTGDLLFTMTWREVEEVTAGLLVLRQAPWLRLVDPTTFVEDGLQLVLAAVTIGAGGVVDTLELGSRRLIVVGAGQLELRRPRASAGPPLVVDQELAGEVRLTGDGGLTVNLLSPAGAATQVLGTDAAASTLALLPASGSVGIGLQGRPPQRTLHVEGSEIHSGGPSGGYSFANRDTGTYVEVPSNGERWAWYAAGGAARLWSGSDQLIVRPQVGGLRVAAGASGSVLELAGQDGNLGKLALGAGNITARRGDGTEPIVLDTTNARVGIGTTTPANALHVTANSGLRQNRLYLSGNAGWSSVSYNAFHNDGNSNWVFPDPSRPAVTVEMDDAGGTPRFQVFSTTSASTQAWQLRLGVDGNTGRLTIPADLAVGAGASFGGVVSVHTTTPNPNLVGSVNVTADSGTGICVIAQQGTAVSAVANGANTTGLFCSGTPAAQFTGNVSVSGTLSAGAKQFVIDHPLDPDNRVLAHASVESSERVVVYSGNVTCDEHGTATVALPNWLEALATDFRYQLTCVGGHAPVYVSRQVRDNTFEVSGGTAGLAISWQLIGIRHDAWARQHDLVVEEDKPERERGFYHHPEAFGKDMAVSVHWVRNEELVRAHPLLAQQAVRHHADHEARRVQAQNARRQAPSEEG